MIVEREPAVIAAPYPAMIVNPYPYRGWRQGWWHHHHWR